MSSSDSSDDESALARQEHARAALQERLNGIPLLFATQSSMQSAQDLSRPDDSPPAWQSRVGADLSGEDDDEVRSMSLEEATARLNDDTMQLVKKRMQDGERLCYDNVTDLSDAQVSLIVDCDVDSIDFVSKVGGGCAFARSAVTIFLEFRGSQVNKAHFLSAQNCLEAIPKRATDANWVHGRYFTGGQNLPGPQPQPGKARPLQVTMGQVNSRALARPLPLLILFPSKTFELMDSEGMVPMRQMFSRLVLGKKADDLSVSIPRSRLASTASMLMYLHTELLVLCATLTTTAGRHTAVATRHPRFALPTAQNRARSVNAKMQLCGGEWTLTLCYLARFFAALEEVSCIPQNERVFGHSRDDALFTLDADRAKQARDIIQSASVLSCLQRRVSDVDFHVQHFEETVWGPQARTRLAGHEAIDFRDHSRRLRRSGMHGRRRAGGHAMPNPETALLSHKHGFVLQDLLVLRTAVYRFTAHGLKLSMSGPEEIIRIRDELRTEVDAAKAWDMTVDIGYSFVPPFAGRKVVMQFDALRDLTMMLPCKARKPSVEDGLSVYASQYWPLSAQMSSQKTFVGSRGDDNSFSPPDLVSAVRRTQFYDAAFHGARRYGHTEYELQNKIIQKLVSSSVPFNIGRWGRKTKVESGLLKIDDDFDSAMQVLHNDINRRQQASSSLSEQVSCLRFEVTYGIGSEGIDGSVAFQHAQRVATLSRDVQEDGPADDGVSPWWATIIPSSCPIVRIVRAEKVARYALALEERLLCMTEDAVQVARHIVVKRSDPLPDSVSTGLLRWLVPAPLPTAAAVEISLFLAQGWFLEARRQVDARPVKTVGPSRVPVYIPKPFAPTWFLRLTGMEAGVCSFGIPYVALDILAEAFPILRFVHPALQGPSVVPFRSQQDAWPDWFAEHGRRILWESENSAKYRVFASGTAGQQMHHIGVSRRAVWWSLDPSAERRWDARLSHEEAVSLWEEGNRWISAPLLDLAQAMQRRSSQEVLEYKLEALFHRICVLGVRVLVGDAFEAVRRVRDGLQDGGETSLGLSWYGDATGPVLDSALETLVDPRDTPWEETHSFVRKLHPGSSSAAHRRNRETFLAEFQTSDYTLRSCSAARMAKALLTHVAACGSGFREIQMLRLASDDELTLPVPWPSVRLLSNMIASVIQEVTVASSGWSPAASALETVLPHVQEMLASLLLNAEFQSACPAFIAAPLLPQCQMSYGEAEPPKMLHQDRTLLYFLTSACTEDGLEPVPLLLERKSWWQKRLPRKRSAAEVFQSVGEPSTMSLQQLEGQFQSQRTKIQQEIWEICPQVAVLKTCRKDLRQLHTGDDAEHWWAKMSMLLLDQVAYVAKNMEGSGDSVASRAQEILLILLAMRSKCGGDEGLALHDVAGINTASAVMQASTSLLPVSAVEGVSERELILDQAGGLQQMVRNCYGQSFKIPQQSSHRKGGLKAAAALLCDIGICYKINDASLTFGNIEGVEAMTWCQDEIYLRMPTLQSRPEARLSAQLRLKPTLELLHIARRCEH